MESLSTIKSFPVILYIVLTFSASYSQGNDVNKVYGVTIDAVNNLKNITTSLGCHRVKPTTRIVFDEWIPASDYLTPVNRIHEVSNIMGEILDSYYMSLYSVSQYTARTNEYLDVLGDKVDIWEIGNEINGEWLGNNNDVVAKMTGAYNIVKGRNKKTALTLYYNFNCWENPQNEMFRWTLNNVPQNMRQGLDYVLVSYYEDDCNNYQPNWQRVFDSLQVIFPNSKLGIGECGTVYSDKKEEYINRYYRMRITTKNYVGGYFWWYYKQDCVPNTKPLWTVIDNAMLGISITDADNKGPFKLYNYPNPFNPKTLIKYHLDVSSKVKLSVFDVLGRVVNVLVDKEQTPGKYEIEFDGSTFSSGVYYYVLQISDSRLVKKMMLVK